MTEEDIEKIIRNHIYQDFNGKLMMKTSGKHNKLLGLESLVYLCKKCYQEGVKYGKSIKSWKKKRI